MRLLFLLISLLFVAAGLVFGALNAAPARIDFYWFALDASLGVLLLLAAFAGAIAGGVALWVGKIWPLQRALQRARREASRRVTPEPTQPSDATPGVGSDPA